MEAITLEQSAYLAEIVGVFAIVVSLIYLTLQVRQNTRSTRLETVQAINTEFVSWMDMIGSNRELTEIYHRGLFDLQSLDVTQRLQFSIALSRLFRTIHELYFQWQEGAVDATIWHSWTATCADVLQYPGFQEIWKTRRHQYGKDFQSFMDNLIEAKDTKPIHEPPEQ